MLGEPQHGNVTSNHLETETERGQPVVYQIRLMSHLSSEWTDWFEGLTITLEENGDTLLSGPVVDQAALFGLLKKVRDLGMTLVSVNQVRIDKSNLENGNKNECK